MAEQVKRLPSKIVQYNNADDVALCEDGSVWYYYDREKKWTQIHPPHQPPTQAGTISAMRHDRQLTDDEIERMAKPPTQAADLAEALEVLRCLMNKATLRVGCDISVRAFQRAESLLEKHGIEPWDDEDAGTTFTEEDLRQ